MGWTPETEATVKQLAGLDQEGSIKANTEARNAAESAAKLPGVAADSAIKATEAAQVKEFGMTLDKKKAVDARLAEIAKANTPAELAVVASDPNKTPAEREVANAALKILQQHAVASRPVSNTSVAANLSPEAIEMLARNVAAGGQMPSLGRNAGGTIAQVFNTAAKQDPALDMASTKADYKANSASLTAQTKMADAVKSFESTALKNLDQFLSVSTKAIDTGSPWLNTPLRHITEKMVGSSNMTAFNVARQVAVVEIAKVLNNPGLSGVLSDSARHEVQELIGKDATLKQIHTAANILKTDMHNRRVAIDAQLAETRKRIGGASAAPASPKADPLGIR